MSPKNSKIKVGISCGDPNGIGLEALADALSDERSLSSMVPVVFAPRPLAEAAFENVPWGEVEDAGAARSGQINLVTFEADDFEHKPGEAHSAAVLNAPGAPWGVQNNGFSTVGGSRNLFL